MRHSGETTKPRAPAALCATCTQAACWAAKHGKPHETYAAAQLFLDEDRDENLIIHSDPAQRAEQIRTCAIEADSWAEDK